MHLPGHAHKEETLALERALGWKLNFLPKYTEALTPDTHCLPVIGSKSREGTSFHLVKHSRNRKPSNTCLKSLTVQIKGYVKKDDRTHTDLHSSAGQISYPIC